ncbi:hypothetical protein OH77DRAFT_66779 [Trametes cingulata]|nr:hypothetical protein OH77DRAFT_66779 [Trametes cingulata]
MSIEQPSHTFYLHASPITVPLPKRPRLGDLAPQSKPGHTRQAGDPVPQPACITASSNRCGDHQHMTSLWDRSRVLAKLRSSCAFQTSTLSTVSAPSAHPRRLAAPPVRAVRTASLPSKLPASATRRDERAWPTALRAHEQPSAKIAAKRQNLMYSLGKPSGRVRADVCGTLGLDRLPACRLAFGVSCGIVLNRTTCVGWLRHCETTHACRGQRRMTLRSGL